MNMKGRFWASTGLFLIVMGGSNLAGAGVINFDVDALSNPIGNGAMIDNAYAPGVTLSSLQTCPICSPPATPGDAFAVSVGTAAASTPNVFGIGSNFFLFDSRWGAGVATFSTGQFDVGIYAAAVPFVENLGQPEKAKPFLTAYDSSGTFITAALYAPNEGDADYGTYQKLIVHSGLGNIASVHFSSQQPSQFTGPNSIVYGIFDNLAFGGDVTDSASAWRSALSIAGPGNSPGPDSSVPEPVSLLLVGTALIGVVGLRKKARS